MNPPPLPDQTTGPSNEIRTSNTIAICFVVALAGVAGLIFFVSQPSGPRFGGDWEPEKAATPISKTTAEQVAEAHRMVEIAMKNSRPIVPRASVLNQHEEYDADRGRTFFTGLVTNNTAETISWLGVEYSLYDETGAKIGQAVDSIQNLRGHEVWRFKAQNFETGMRRYRFEGLTMR